MEHRSFVALFPSPSAIKQILAIQNTMKHFSDGIRWETESKFHFTLQFFGTQSDEWIERTQQQIQNLCKNTERFPVTISAVGCFPYKQAPRIFWIGSSIEQNVKLTSLAKEIQRITTSLGLQPDKKPFYPHITIGRTKRKINTNLIQKVETITFHPINFLCTEIHIMKSQLANTGSTFSTLFTIPLQ